MFHNKKKSLKSYIYTTLLSSIFLEAFESSANIAFISIYMNPSYDLPHRNNSIYDIDKKLENNLNQCTSFMISWILVIVNLFIHITDDQSMYNITDHNHIDKEKDKNHNKNHDVDDISNVSK